MRTMLRATVFLAPLILVGALASAPWAGAVWLCGGLLMIILAARGRSWTVWASAPDWPGMTTDPLFKRINAALSAMWGASLPSPAWRCCWAAGPSGAGY